MAREYQIGMLWVDGPLSFLEQVCIKSYLDVGQSVRLYTYGNVTNIPDGVEQRDAREILPVSEFITHSRTGSPAPHSDKFRYRMLAQEPDLIWADTDAYCLKPFTTPNGHYYGYLEGEVAIGVLALPQDSETLGKLIEFTRDPYRILPWMPPRHRKPLEEALLNGTPVNVPEVYWGAWGPKAFTWALKQTGEIKYALPEHVFYPLNYTRRRALARPGARVDQFMHEDTVSIHLYGRRMRAIMRTKYGGKPDPESLIGKLVEKHGIDPLAAPIQPHGGDEGSAAGIQE
ncbi:hypothetical protein [Ruegeria profundi]|uniref:Alpha 1,4-glycosyltransferase domain-containing protein n=1 Tax=Ruegeria profundi TaxID=1685378 RepID=A0A0X3TLP6_9RHOB|nr:hypothetical protein [Ruegeria profundi]KUJ76705.1 hypothetical protein AVO44_19235 [Ruegeria profundi]